MFAATSRFPQYLISAMFAQAVAVTMSVALPRALGPERFPEDLLPQPDGIGRHLDQLVFVDPLDRALEAHHLRRRQDQRLVLAGRTDVGELLLADDVDGEIVLARVLADD